MRRVTEFKGYRSIVEYDAEAGTFVTRTVPDSLSEHEPAPKIEAEIVPFPEPDSNAQKQRMAG